MAEAPPRRPDVRPAEAARALRGRALRAADPATAAALRGEIVALLSPVVARGGPPPALMLLAETLIDSGAPAAALDVLARVPPPLGASVPADVLRSRALFGLGRVAEGLAEARAVLEREPGHALAAMQLRTFAAWDAGGDDEEDDVPGGVGVVVGSGLGNLIHATPLIRCLAQWLGTPVEVIVAEDHPDSAPILAHPEFVSAVRRFGPAVVRRRFDRLLVLNAFGITRIPFAAEETLWSRDWIAFRPDGGMHEAVFNLEAARLLLGMPYAAAEAHRPFVAGAARVAADGAGGGGGAGRGLVGLHAGSKGGIWATKRWPHYAALAAALSAEGYRVASFGLPSEYVPGTEDRTGGTVPEMAAAMADCTAFIANDSGVMNVANALGLPLLALFGPTDWRTRGPLGDRARSLPLERACAPCELVAPDRFHAGTCDCLASLSVAAVLAAFRATLAGAAADPRQDGVPLRAETRPAQTRPAQTGPVP